MGYSSVRFDDERQSDIVSQFLDKYFYCDAKTFERVNDKNRQVSGIDVIFNMSHRQYVCDEKAAIRYRNLKTFCMELTFLNKHDELMDGWLIDPHKVNDSFLFVWIDKTKTDTIRSIDDIQVVEVALVRKSEIIAHLADYGWTVDKLKIKARRILNNPNVEMGNVRERGYCFSYSDKLPEKPVNVLISRKHLVGIGDINRKIEIK
jgi:hypothetical protein